MMYVDGVFAGRHTAAEGGFVVELQRIGNPPEVVAQQVKDQPALIGVADRCVARRLDPKIDIGVELVGPAQLDDDVARRLGDEVGLGHRVDVGQQ